MVFQDTRAKMDTSTAAPGPGIGRAAGRGIPASVMTQAPVGK